MGHVLILKESPIWTGGQSAWGGPLLGVVCAISASDAKVDKLICLQRRDKRTGHIRVNF